MKKNENIFISLQIQKDAESKTLMLSVQFDKNAPNLLLEDETISWSPTDDEINFIAEAFELIGGNKAPLKEKNRPQDIDTPPSQTEEVDYSHRSSEIRIAPLPNDMGIEVSEDLGPSNLKKKEYEEKIFIQADEKKIDEILKRKKHLVKEDYITDSNEKTIIDRMMKQKKKK
ncbi:MAG TPA: hypothetical protein DSN98_02345 [Thermoplasmata archaeon]|nr:MAG TPA: hypothetical protein DSN98_02345 [Thermoplasmata archaeon]